MVVVMTVLLTVVAGGGGAGAVVGTPVQSETLGSGQPTACATEADGQVAPPGQH